MYYTEQKTIEEITPDKAKNDKGKINLTLVPTEIIRAIAEVREYGVKKYKRDDNWKTVAPERYVAALYRHLLSYLDGEICDRESGLPHTWHMACNIAFIIELTSAEATTGMLDYQHCKTLVEEDNNDKHYR